MKRYELEDFKEEAARRFQNRPENVLRDRRLNNAERSEILKAWKDKVGEENAGTTDSPIVATIDQLLAHLANMDPTSKDPVHFEQNA